jgi:hypothetical protein
MRLAMSFFILVVAVLNFQFGQPQLGLQLANMVAGMLLVLSVIVDHFFPMTSPVSPSPVSPSAARPDTTQAEPTQTAS